MRISVVEHDSGFSPNAKQAKVTLDGVEVKGCITADEDGGFVRIRADDRPGGTIRRGKVEIVMPDSTKSSHRFNKPFEQVSEE